MSKGGSVEHAGWLQDRCCLRWQITPKWLAEEYVGPDLLDRQPHDVGDRVRLGRGTRFHYFHGAPPAAGAGDIRLSSARASRDPGAHRGDTLVTPAPGRAPGICISH